MLSMERQHIFDHREMLWEIRTLFSVVTCKAYDDNISPSMTLIYASFAFDIVQNSLQGFCIFSFWAAKVLKYFSPLKD